MIEALQNLLLGDSGGLRKRDPEKLASREPLSEYLPWVAYDEERKRYLNTDNTYGFLWECTPLTYASTREMDSLESMLKLPFPKGTVISFALYADEDISGYIERYKAGKTRDNPLVRRTVAEFINFIEEGAKGLPQLHGIPLRNFRVFVSVKSTEEIDVEQVSIIEETLAGGAKLQPRHMPPSELLAFTRRLINKDAGTNPVGYDETLPIRKQVIFADTEIKPNENDLQIGKRHARCLTPKMLPKHVGVLDTNKLMGGIMGIPDDTEQINAPFLWTVNVILNDIQGSVKRKAGLIQKQKVSSRFIAAISRRAEESGWILDEAEDKRYVQAIPTLWIFGNDTKHAREATARAKRIWEQQGYVMQEEKSIAKPLFIAALPFGLYNVASNIFTLDRDFPITIKGAARLLPIQADFAGSTTPVMPLIGRKGQVSGLDVFDSRSNNHNLLITAASGGGKSFSLNALISNYYASGAKIRVTDLGYSYKKLSQVVGGRFMDFGRDTVVINPFSSTGKDEEDRASDLNATAAVIAEMIYSASTNTMTETEWSLVKQACLFAVERDNGTFGVDHVAEYLSTYPALAGEHRLDEPKVVANAKEMAYNLYDFTSKGSYGKFFNGPTNFNISDDDFVVLELENLKTTPELFKVAVLQVMNSVTQDLYLSSREDPRFLLFDESWEFLRKGERMSAIIEEGYRRARKYTGSFGIVTQSMMDTQKFGEAGSVIRTNSAFKLFLEAPDYGEAVDAKLLPYEGLALDLLNSVRNNAPRYSEIFVETPFGRGPVRLVVDPWMYWIATSSGKEVAQFEHLISSGMTPVKALEQLSGRKAA